MNTKPSKRTLEQSAEVSRVSGSGTDFSRTQFLSRPTVGVVLLFSAAICLAGAIILDQTQVNDNGLGPIPFVSAILFVKLGLFAFWPVVSKKSANTVEQIKGVFKDKVLLFDLNSTAELDEQLSTLKSNDRRTKPENMRLWNEDDPRVDLALFHASVPTMILNHEQKILDWNPAFELAFGERREIKRFAPLAVWYDCLDNFRRVSQRADKLVGEGILPLADRERATFISKTFGRMVFTRIMNPIVERNSGKTIGWTIVLNINSITKRQLFFEKLHKKIADDTRDVRYAASFDGLYKRYPAYAKLVRDTLEIHEFDRHVLNIGAHTGILAQAMLRKGMRVTAMEHDVHLLRKVRQKGEPFPHKLRIVRQDLDQLRKIPEEKYNGVALHLVTHRIDFPEDMFKQAFQALKPGGTLSLAAILPSGGVDQLYKHLRESLEERKQYSALQLQFDNVYNFEKRLSTKYHYRFKSREELRALMIEAGFEILKEESEYLDGHTTLFVARKPG